MSTNDMVAVHVTHEAIQKIGGIGAVIQGLVTANCYAKTFPHTLLYTPLFDKGGDISNRLGPDAEVLYSSIDGRDTGKWGAKFGPIESQYGIKIVYGKKMILPEADDKKAVKADIVAVDMWNMEDGCVEHFKFKLWERFGIESHRFKDDRDYEQYLRIGVAVVDIFEAIYGGNVRACVFSHEYMGMASALSFVIERLDGRRSGDVTLFHAHEVSTARNVVEGHPGHDLSFYNVMKSDQDAGISLEESFGYRTNSARNELVKRAQHLSAVLAVSDVTRDEYLYLCPKADPKKIMVAYNGIPVDQISFDEKKVSVEMMRDWCERMFTYRPEYIFTHVTRLVVSKAIWRDIRLLYHLDEHLAKVGGKGFFVIVSTLIGTGRPDDAVAKMERDYGWPVLHREGWPDLVAQEIDIYRYLEMFNARSRVVKGVFINQFGFSRGRCGDRVPEKADIRTLREASDMEFGMSIYEPFGIAQLETLPYGGLPLVSKACGCASVLREKMKPSDYLEIDFSRVPSVFADRLSHKEDFLAISKEMRDSVETEICREAASEIAKALPNGDKDRKLRLEGMQSRGKKLDWEHAAGRICEIVNSLS